MKTFISLGLTVAMCALWNASPALAGGSIRANAIIPTGVGNEVVQADGTLPSSPDDLLYNKQLCPGEGLHPDETLNPVLAPDGRHITWGEYSRVQGQASLRCGPEGTRVTLELTGLIPNGVYTIWVFTFADGVAGPIGAGALGAPDGTGSVVAVSATGEGSIDVHHPAGALSGIGETTGCLFDAFEFHLVGAYHLDGEVYGPGPAPLPPPVGGCYWVPHFAFVFGQEQDGFVRANAIIPTGVGNEVVRADGTLPGAPDDLLFNKQLCPGEGLHAEETLNPVVAPDGGQVTWGDYSQVQGQALLRCGSEGTRVRLELTGLIPNGVYTVWLFTFGETSPPPMLGSGARSIGAGALGAPDGSQSVITASAAGEGSIDVHHPAGALSAAGEVGACLFDELEFHLVGAYHLDGLVYGPVPAPLPPPVGGCYWVPHFAFAFGQPALTVQAAVRVSWSATHDGYVLDAADKVDGPWRAVPATPVREGNNHIITVPAENASEFYRLRRP